MTLTVDLRDLAERLPELVAEVEAGRDVVIERGSAPFARLASAVKDRQMRSIVADIRAARQGFKPTTLEEIVAWKDEDKR